MSSRTGELLELLAGGRIELEARLPGASNHTFLVRVEGGESSLRAVYKPRAGEAPLWDFRDGSLAGREVAAYQMAAELGWPKVPPTVLRDGPFGPGAVQLYVDADPGQHFFTLREERLQDFRPVAVFDALVNNADRKGGHCLLGADGEIWLVDHGLCFNEEPKLRTVIWEFAGEPIPDTLREDLSRIVEGPIAGPLGERLGAFLTDAEIAATTQRAHLLRREGRFPEPGSERAVPWPPI